MLDSNATVAHVASQFLGDLLAAELRQAELHARIASAANQVPSTPHPIIIHAQHDARCALTSSDTNAVPL